MLSGVWSAVCTWCRNSQLDISVKWMGTFPPPPPPGDGGLDSLVQWLNISRWATHAVHCSLQCSYPCLAMEAVKIVMYCLSCSISTTSSSAAKNFCKMGDKTLPELIRSHVCIKLPSLCASKTSMSLCQRKTIYCRLSTYLGYEPFRLLFMYLWIQTNIIRYTYFIQKEDTF